MRYVFICYNDKMNTPFPGMDPYLEHPYLWPEVHNSLAIAIAHAVTPHLAPKYYVAVESRTYPFQPFEQLKPSAEVRIGTGQAAVVEVVVPSIDELKHHFLEIRGVQTKELVATVELLSADNKLNPIGRDAYLARRSGLLHSRTSLVEIDLLRAGEPMPLNKRVASDYRILVSRGWTRRKAQLYAFSLDAPIPDFPLPLSEGEEEPLVPLNQILHDLYGRARFDLRLDYSQPPVPPLTETQAEWARGLLVS